MNAGTLFLLGTFIVPIFSLGYSFFKLSKDGLKWRLSEIILFIVIALFHLGLGCAFYFELDSWLKNFIAGNVILNSCFFVALEMFSCQCLKSFMYKMLLSVGYLVNGWFVLFGLVLYDYPTSLLIATLLLYPFVSVFQILLCVIERNETRNTAPKRNFKVPKRRSLRRR